MNTIDNPRFSSNIFIDKWSRRMVFADEYRPDDLFDKLDGLPGKIRDMTIGVERMKLELVNITDDLKLAEAEIMDAICSELNGNNKPRFSNDTTRKNELIRRLASDPETDRIEKLLQERREEIVIAEAQIEGLKTEYRIIKLKIETYNAELGVI